VLACLFRCTAAVVSLQLQSQSPLLLREVSAAHAHEAWCTQLMCLPHPLCAWCAAYVCSEPALVKVEVGVHLPTQPGQRVLLSGNHPTLGSWDLGRAWKLRWSEGHIWRGCFELPADIAAIEFKVRQRSGENSGVLGACGRGRASGTFEWPARYC
jgi:hypothetical protein